MSRWVVVDDTDPDLTYTGPWFQDLGTLNNLGNYGPPHLNTLHGSNSNASFSYSFRGSIVRITGTNQWTNPAGVINPSWQCEVDGVSVPSKTLSPATPENRLLYCEMDGLADGPHLITVNVTVTNQTFWFDYIQYLPSTGASLDQASFFIEASDSGYQYGTGWSSVFPGTKTEQTNSTVSFEFNGTFLTWLGFYDNTLPTAATTATYSIDGQSPITFNLNGAAAVNTGVQYNQVFFHSDQLSPGLHSLDVVYQGNSQTAPLTLYELFLENNASSSSSSSSSSSLSSASSLTPTSSPAGTPTGTSNPSLHHSSNLGPIIGGVVGGLALIVFAILTIFFLRRRNKRLPEETANVTPFIRSSTALLSPVAHSSSNIPHFKPQTLDLSGYEYRNDTNATSPLSQLSPSPPTRMIQVDTATPSSTPGLREHPKGGEFMGRVPPSQPETRALHLSPSSTTGNRSQPTRLVQEEDAGVQLTGTTQYEELLPPVYSF